MEKNTYIFFTADHGLGVGHHGLLGKQNLYEHSTRVPFIVSGPGVPQNKKIQSPIYLQDVMPSTLAIAGVQKPDHVDFKKHNALSLRQKRPAPLRRNIRCLFRRTALNYRGKREALVYPNVPTVRVYNISKDPFEMNDIAKTKQGKAIASKLFPRLLNLQNKMADNLDLKKSFPELSKNLSK